MTTTPTDPRAAVLGAARAAVTARMRADADLLAAAAQWALLHPVVEAVDAAGWVFGEDLVALAGPGAPLVAEFAPAELAAVLGWRTETVTQLMGEAWELQTRLRRVWADVQALRLSVPLARFAAEQTRDLDPDQARRADRLLAGAAKLTRPMITRIVEDIRLHADPDRAVALEQNALAARGVEVRPGLCPATLEVVMSLDVADAEAFEDTVAHLADRLGRLGDPGDLEVRRARAVGILAHPQAALDLLCGEPSDTEAAAAAARVNLDLHLDLATLADLALRGLTGPVHAERYGTAPTDLVHQWLTGWLVFPPQRVATRGPGSGWVGGASRGLAAAAARAHQPPAAPRGRRAAPARPPHPQPRPAVVTQAPAQRSPPRQPRAPVQAPPPGQDPRPLDLPTPAQRRLPLDHPHR
jgi:hypothetical protein